MKKYKIITSTILTAIAVASPIVAIVSCGNNSNNNSVTVKDSDPAKSWQKESRRNISVITATDDGRQPYFGQGWRFQPSVTNGIAVLAEAQNATSAQGFTVVVDGFPRYSVDGSLVSGKLPESHIEFALYDNVKVILRDKTEVIFDSDSTDPSDKKSINGDNFKKTIAADGPKQVASFVFHLREGVNWINCKGEEVAPVTTDDIWDSIQYSLSSFGKERNNAVGTVSAYLDETWNGRYQTTFTPALPQEPASPWKGGYRTTYGLDISPVANGKKENFVNEKERTNTFNFIEGTETRKIVSYWNQTFGNWGGYLILPVKQYKKASQNVDNELIDGYVKYVKNNKNSPRDISRETAKREIEESLGWKSGLYGSTTLEALDYWGAGQYYTSHVSEKNIVFTQNKHFANQKWVQLPNTILTYSFEYISNAGDYKTAIFEGYKEGLYTGYSAIGELPENVKKEILNNPEKFGVHFSKGRTVLSQVDKWRSRFNFLNVPTTEIAAKNFYFNDAFAKVAFGAKKGLLDLVNYESEGVYQDPVAFQEANFHGTGVEFRSSVYAAINWFSAVYDNSHHKNQEWNSRSAPEQTLTPASGDKSEVYPIQVEDIYSTYGIGYEESKPSVTQVSHKERVEIATDTTKEGVDKRYLAGAEDLAQLKRNIKHALDSAGIGPNEKVTFQLPHEYTPLSRDYRLGLEGIRKAINSLDSRLHAVASFRAIDPLNTGDNPTDGSNAAGGWRESFSPDDATWTVCGPGVTDQDALKNELIKRIDYGLAVLPFSLNSGISFEVDSLSQIWGKNLGYLQDGTIFALSYYRQHPDLLPEKFSYLANFADKEGTIIDKHLKGITLNQVRDIATSRISNLDADDEAKIALTHAGLNHLEFNKIVDSKPADLAKYDYFGFAGDTEWTALKNYVNDRTYEDNYNKITKEIQISGIATDDQNKELEISKHKFDVWSALKDTSSSLISEVLNQQSEYEIRSWFDTITQDQKIQILTALDTYVGGPWVLSCVGLLGNREDLTPYLSKDWYHSNSNVYSVSYLGSYRVDLE